MTENPPDINDVKELLQSSLDWVATLLEENGSFTPSGLVLLPDGKYRPGSGPGADANEDLSLLFNAYREEAERNEILAAAIASDVLVALEDGSKADAILIHVESLVTRAIRAIKVYRKTTDGEYEYDELDISHVDNVIFGNG